jgi:hypothetical protein
VRLFAQGVAGDQAFGGEPGAVDIAGLETSSRDDRERILEVIGEALALRGEAVVAEALGEVAAVQVDRGLSPT